MSTLTVRTPGGQNLNICDSEWYLRNDENTGWIRIDPQNDVRVRHGSNEYWLPILCDGDNELCPPESIVNCWPGYSGIFDSAEFKPGGSTGYLVCKCDGTDCKTYTGHTPDFNVVGGRFFSTAPIDEGATAPSLPVTFYGNEAQVTEMLVNAGSRSGAIDVSLLLLDPGVRVRIYHDCNLIGDSDVTGPYFNVFFSAEPSLTAEDNCGVTAVVNNFITVRVDAPAGARWRIRLGEVNTVVTSSFQRPAPCFGTFSPHLPCFVDDENHVIPGRSVYEMIHQIPSNGLVHIDTTIRGDYPVTFTVFHNGTALASTTTENTPENPNTISTLAFNFNAVGGDNFIVLRYEAYREYNDWAYAIYCPGQRGSRLDMMTCAPVPAVIPFDVLCTPLNGTLPPEWTVVGKGAPYTDIYYDYSGKISGHIVVEYFSASPVQLIFYQGMYPNEVMVGATQGFTTGHNRLYFDFDPARGTALHVRAAGPCCPEWAFMVSCPVKKPVFNIFDAEITRGPKGQTDMLCLTVELENKTPKDVTFDWVATPITALESTDGTCTITEDVPDSPYCNIIGTHVAQYGGATNDVNIGYNARRIASSAHNVNCAVGGQYYVLECDFEFPYTGTYTFVGTADDNLRVYVNCELVVTKGSTWSYNQSTQFQAKKGWGTISLMYQNVPNCTPGWVKCVFLNTATGAIVFATNETAYTWRSKVGAITVEPDPVPLVYGADFNKSSGSGTIRACTLTSKICVPVCGSDLMGPDVTFQVTVSNVKNAVIGDLVGIGTIKNANHYDCSQNTQLTVLDGGPDQYVNRGARKIYVNAFSTNAGSAYVMDTTIDLPVSGLYTIYFYGLDTAELYVDCGLVARISGATSATKVRMPLNKGGRKVYINYYANAGKTRRTGYAALAIVDPLNRVVYASNAPDWRGRVISVGSPPSCNQFPDTCRVTPTGTVTSYAPFGDKRVGYGAKPINSTLHAPACAPGGTFFTMERKLTFPVSGNYTFRGIADDTLDIYIDCKLVHSGTLSAISQNQVNVTAGEHLVTVSYKNVPACTPGYAVFVFIKPDGNVFYASDPDGWVSAMGSLVQYQPLYDNMTAWGVIGVHPGPAYNGKGYGPQYGYWSAERDFIVPADGNYYVTGSADDGLGLYIDCVGRPLNGTRFSLNAGPTKFHVRVYNLKAKDETWFQFNLYKADGTLVYTARADGWRARIADLDFTGLS